MSSAGSGWVRLRHYKNEATAATIITVSPFAAGIVVTNLNIFGESYKQAATITHEHMTIAERMVVGIDDGLIRLSEGLEDAVDIIADLDQALTAI